MRRIINSIACLGLLCLVPASLTGCNSDSELSDTNGDATLSCGSTQPLEYVAKTSVTLASASCDEKPLTVEGRIEALFALEENNRETYEYRLTTDTGERYGLIFQYPIADYQTDERIEVTGTLMFCDDASAVKILLVQSSTRVNAMLTTAALSGTIGDQRTAVILVSFTDQQTTDTIATAQNVVFNTVNSFWRENSFNQTSISGDAFGPYTIALSKSACDSDAIATAAKAAAQAAGVDLSRYNRHVFAFPKNGCSWYGLGTIGGNPSKAWLNNSLTKFTTAHELGHNLGLYHANAHDCGTTTLGATCSKIEYGDTTDVMGNRLAAHYNAFQKERLGWMTPTLVSTSGTYTLSPYETLGAGSLALKILKSSTTSAKTYYYLEYRQPVGSDSVLAGSSTYNLTKGVVVHTGSTSSGNTSLLLNMNPQLASWYKAALTVGQTFTDPDAGVSFTLTAHDAGGATVSVSINNSTPPAPAPCVRATPTITLAAAQSQAIPAATIAAYTVSVRNNDSQNCAAQNFDLAATLPSSAWSATISTPRLVNISPGNTAISSLTVKSPIGTSAGSYQFTVKATPTTGTSASATGTYRVAAPDQLIAALSMTRVIFNRGDLIEVPIAIKLDGQAVTGATYRLTVTSPDGKTSEVQGTSENGATSVHSFRAGPCVATGNYVASVSTTYGARSASNTVAFSVH